MKRLKSNPAPPAPKPLPAWASNLKARMRGKSGMNREAIETIDKLLNARSCEITTEYTRKVEYDFAFLATMEFKKAHGGRIEVLENGTEVRVEMGDDGRFILFRHLGARPYLPCDGPRPSPPIFAIAHLPDMGLTSWTAMVENDVVRFVNIETGESMRVSPTKFTAADLEAAETETRRMAAKILTK